MNIWKPIAIGCVGYIAGINARRGYGGNYVGYNRRYGSVSLKDELIDILAGKFYYLVWGETREQTNDRRLDRRFGRPISYAPVYHSAGGGGSYTAYINRKYDDESEENEDDET